MLATLRDSAERVTPSLVADRRTESRRERAKAYLRGLLLDAESTKTAEAIALKVHGDPSQVRMTQVFLGQSAWADEPPREELVRWADQELGSPAGTLIVDLTLEMNRARQAEITQEIMEVVAGAEGLAG